MNRGPRALRHSHSLGSFTEGAVNAAARSAMPHKRSARHAPL